jgi:hypothetical protein
MSLFDAFGGPVWKDVRKRIQVNIDKLTTESKFHQAVPMPVYMT